MYADGSLAAPAFRARAHRDRTSQALAWSALAAGLSIGLSMLAEAALRLRMPEAPWRPLVVSLGYTVSFLVVTLSRQQLYTETTLTALLPVFHGRSAMLLKSALPLWIVVLLANLVGASCSRGPPRPLRRSHRSSSRCSASRS
jgi:formate/nitrite transporter FocA (FNT family)